MAELQRTSVNRSWLVKMVIFAAVCIGFGSWGLVDATVIYPNRGLEDASYKLREYLRAAEAAGRLDTVSTPDPRERLDDLRERRADLAADYRKLLDAQSIATQNTPQGQAAARELRTLAPSAVEYAALQWLESLAVVRHLSPERTTIANPRARLAELESQWKSKEPPKPLAVYDLPLQWVFTVLGFGLSLYLAFLILKVRGTVYRWDAAEKRLVLPGGRSFTPADIADFDKRKWDKFFVFISFKDGSPELKLDLLRWVPLEAWILEMERHAFPDRDAGKPADEKPAQGEPAQAAS